MNTCVDKQKLLATCKARAALAGVVLREIEGDDGRPEYVASRWALCKRFADLQEVEAWLDLIGAPA